MKVKSRLIIKEQGNQRYLLSSAEYDTNNNLLYEKEYYPDGKLFFSNVYRFGRKLILFSEYEPDGTLSFSETSENIYDEKNQIIEVKRYSSENEVLIEKYNFDRNKNLIEQIFQCDEFVETIYFEYDKMDNQKGIYHFLNDELKLYTEIVVADNQRIVSDYTGSDQFLGTHIYNYYKKDIIKEIIILDEHSELLSKSEYFYDQKDRCTTIVDYDSDNCMIKVTEKKYLNNSELILEEIISNNLEKGVDIENYYYEYEFY